MSVNMNMYQPATTSIVSQQQFATPVNQVWESVAAPVTTLSSAPVSYANMTTMAAPQYTTTMAAQPTYTTMAAQPTYTTTMSTMAAPTVVETMAAPTTYQQYAAPAVQYASAPITTMAAPMTGTVTYQAGGSISAPIAMAPQQIQTYAPQTTMITQAPSYVAQPMVQQQIIQAPQVVQAVMEAPKALTVGIPNPEQIKVQKEAYSAALDKQLKDGVDTIQKETEIEKNMIKFTADKQMALMQMQVEEQRNEQIAFLEEQATIRQCELRKAYVERKLQLDNQANGFVMDYQMKAVQTELAQKQYEFQVTYANKEGALEAQYAKAVAEANTGTTYTVPAQATR